MVKNLLDQGYSVFPKHHYITYKRIQEIDNVEGGSIEKNWL